MNRKIIVLLVAMILLDVMDGDFVSLSIFDCVKVVLYLICIVLVFVKGDE